MSEQAKWRVHILALLFLVGGVYVAATLDGLGGGLMILAAFVLSFAGASE